MPAILTHYSFALEAIPEVDRPHRDITNLGSQGPDTFMAYGSIPWRKRTNIKKIRDFGHLMHRLDITETYVEMAEYARGKEKADLLYAYIDGILMHYSVDRLMHAYIFYRSGVDENGGLSGYYSWSHGFFEAILDKVFAKKKGTYQKMYRCIECEDKDVMEVSRMWAACAPVSLGEDDFYLSYLDFVGAEKLLYNPGGVKRPLFRLIGKYSTPNAQAHPVNVHKFDAMDILNEKHAIWHNPATDEHHDESIEDLFELALKDFAEVHEILLASRRGEDVRERMREWTKSLDHEGGPIGVKKSHYSLCWEVLGKTKYLPR